nr:MAG TPA: hypothetical protein [Caudoviricetes sp.]
MRLLLSIEILTKTVRGPSQSYYSIDNRKAQHIVN